MGTTPLFKITHLDVVLQLNGLQELGLPLVGPGGGLAESVVMSYANRAESAVASNIPEMYRQMLREVRGEIVVEAAYKGQKTFVCGMRPVLENSLDLYVDYNMPTNDRMGDPASRGFVVNAVVRTSDGPFGSDGRTPYSFRSVYDKLPEDKFTLAPATGEVTLTFELLPGQRVFADYRHDGMAECHNLKDIAIRLAAANLGGTLAGITDSARNALVAMEQNAMELLAALMRGDAGVDMLDQLKLVDETRQPYRTPRRSSMIYM